jgi:hypothetical protein
MIQNEPLYFQRRVRKKRDNTRGWRLYREHWAAYWAWFRSKAHHIDGDKTSTEEELLALGVHLMVKAQQQHPHQTQKAQEDVKGSIRLRTLSLWTKWCTSAPST